MFGFFASQEKKMRENASNWLELADKVYHYRRDVLSDAHVGELQSHIQGLRTLLKERDNSAKLKLAIDALEEVLRRTGGSIYPKSALVENVEFFLVAAIVILGIRTYFVQPFKIPTNSMWPTYNGMTPQVFHTPAEEPNAAMKAVRFLAFGATPRRAIAPVEGEVMIPIPPGGRLPYDTVDGRTWLVFPTKLKQYTLFVGDKPVTVKVPIDFDFEWAVRDAFFAPAVASHEPGHVDLDRVAASRPAAGRWGSPYGDSIPVFATGKRVKAGESALAFDIITGDQLFVDRISYHFVRPAVGSGFVFRTGNIPGIRAQYGDQYYIKRLVGTPGDTLEIRDFTLYRNNAPITGADAFALNAKREGNYVGYRNGVHDPARGRYELLAPKEKLNVPAQNYFALGDNSANSADGRYWGFVPAKDVVGRPLWVYYPFTKHWGPAR